MVASTESDVFEAGQILYDAGHRIVGQGRGVTQVQLSQVRARLTQLLYLCNRKSGLGTKSLNFTSKFAEHLQ